MKAENIEDIYELTPIQKGILFHSLYAPELGLYFFQTRLALRGNLNVVAFDRAWQQVVARHAILRTGFYWENIDKPLQVVYQQVKVPLVQHDWREIDPIEQQQRLKLFLESDRARGFDLSQECQMRLTLFRLTNTDYEFIWSRHFIILDGWSIPLVIDEVAQLYEAFCRDRYLILAPSISYRNYIAWLEEQDLSKAEAFWRQMLLGLKAPTPLTHLYSDNLAEPEEKYDDEQIVLSEATTTALQYLARKYQLTVNTFVQGAWALLLSRYSCENNIVYGCTVSGRPVDLAGAESMVGMFVNTLPVRIQVDTEQNLLTWLKQLQAQLVEMRQYEYSPLVDVQKWSELPPGVPLFESIVVFENLPVPRSLREEKRSLEVPDSANYYKINYPLTVVAIPGVPLTIGINYDFRRFEAATIISILGHFERLLQGMATHPHLLLKDLLLPIERTDRITSLLEAEVTFDFALCG